MVFSLLAFDLESFLSGGSALFGGAEVAGESAVRLAKWGPALLATESFCGSIISSAFIARPGK